MLLGLLEQRAQCLGDIGETKVHGLAEPIPVPIELGLLEAEVSRERVPATCRCHLGNARGGGAAEERNLLGQDLGVVELLRDMDFELSDSAQELSPVTVAM